MAILQTEAVVLKGWNLGETSKILSVFTREYGKIKVVAKGGRNPKSKFRGCLEPLTVLKIIYYDKRTRELQLLSKADVLDPHIHLIGDVTKTTIGLAAVELLNKAVTGEEALPELFDLLKKVLESLDQKTEFLEGIFWYFETHFIRLMGYEPVWERCLSCKGSLGMEGGFFHPGSGGLLCSKCGSGRGGFIVSGETLEILFWLQRGDFDDVSRLRPQRAQMAEIRKMFDLYFRTHIDHMKTLHSLALYYMLSEKQKDN